MVLHESSHAVLALFVVSVARESIAAYTNTHTHTHRNTYSIYPVIKRQQTKRVLDAQLRIVSYKYLHQSFTKIKLFFIRLGHKELAIELYRKGIKELEDGIAVDCWSGRGDVWDRAQRLHDKMQTNLSMARDRLHFLGK